MKFRAASILAGLLRRPLFLALPLVLITSCSKMGDPLAEPLPTLLASATPSRTVDAHTPTAAPEPTATPTWTETWTVAPTMLPTATPTFTPTPLPDCQGNGQVVQSQFNSAIAGQYLAYHLYLPPCYGQDDRVYPVLYMLPGNIHDDSIWDQLGLDEAAEAGIKNGLLPPMLIVMPEGGDIAYQTSGGPGSYESVMVNELLPFVESSYCAWQDSAGRAIGGLSRGGYWSLEIAFRNPAVFGSVGGHAAALVDTYAGPSLDPKYTALTSDLSTLRVYLDAGNGDWYLTQLQILHDNLMAAGKEHEWVIQEGGHNNDYWAAHVGDYLAWYAAIWPLDRDQLPICDVIITG